MKHAQTNSNQNLSAPGTAAAGKRCMYQDIRGIGKEAQASGDCGNLAPQVHASAVEHATAAVMNSHVSPLWFGSPLSDQIAGNFYASARKLYKSLGLKPPKPGRGSFPENIVSDFDMMEEQMQKMNKPLGLFISDDPAYYGCLGYYNRYEIEPVFLPMEKLGICASMPEESLLAAIIGGAFAYLHIVGLKYPSENQFIESVYNELIEYNYDCDEGDEEDCHNRVKYFEDELIRSRDHGWAAEDFLESKSILEGWRAALNAYQPKEKSRRKVKRACKRLFGVYQTYPGRQIGDACCPELPDANVECLHINQMIGFQFGGQSIVMDELENWVHICWESNPDTILPMGYHLFGPGRGKVVSMRFQHQLYTACTMLHSALCSLQL